MVSLGGTNANAGPSSHALPIDHFPADQLSQGSIGVQGGPGGGGVHMHPHGTHVEEEEDYEALPVGAGWGVNMAAGAMVCH